MSLFENKSFIPLAERCRPASISEFIGQSHILAKGKIISSMIERGSAFSIILWGEPGSGKTTLARLISGHCNMDPHFISAISAGVAEVRKVIEIGRRNRDMGRQTLLFIDEIHRFNKAQQDAVLGAVESGDIVLIGATTENPSFSVISPLLSRTRVIRMNRHSDDDLAKILDKALKNDFVLKSGAVSLEPGVAERLVSLAAGDARRMLNILESAFFVSGNGTVKLEHIDEAVKNSVLYYDKTGDRHYDTISAFIKSMRGSDPDASVYYLAKMILSGEDPEFIARRMVIFASEDIGNAAPGALSVAVAAMTAVKNIGMPESEIILSQCATYLASSPKSNASYMAIRKAKAIASASDFEIPRRIRNAPTDLMKDMGNAAGYKYPHDFPGHFVDEKYLPDEIAKEVFYSPSEEGSEKSIAERLRKIWPGRY